MQQTQSHHASLNLDVHRWTRAKTRLLRVALLLTAVALLAMLALPAVSRAAELIVPRRDSGAASQETTRSVTDDAEQSFEERARRLAASGSEQAFEALTQTLKAPESASQRDLTIHLLTDASPQVVPVLTRALNDPDDGVRAGAAEVLGLRHEYQAIAALEMATHDPKARVRLRAAESLGDIYAWQDLPRLAELQVDEGNADVRAAARAAASSIQAHLANEIGVRDSQVLAVSVTTSNAPWLYAATKNDLYTRQGATWEQVSRVPDVPLALATGPDAKVLYLTTATSGLYRSADGGETWQPVSFALDAPAQLTVTAIAVSPHDSRRVYAALANLDAATHRLNGLGVATSSDGGKSWTWLPDAPAPVVTTRLIADPITRGYLYGLADDTPWRYELVTLNELRPDLSL